MLFLYLLLLVAAPVLSFTKRATPPIVKHGMFPGRPGGRGSTYNKRAAPLGRRQAPSSGSCDTGNTIAAHAPKSNIFAGLTDDEAAAVTLFAHGQKSLNLTAIVNATEWDNKLLQVELIQPNKADALKFFDSGGAAPQRYARVVVQFGATLEPYIQEFQVGPLPVANGTTTLSQLNSPYTKGKGYIRVYDQDQSQILAFTYQISTSIADLTQRLINGTALGAMNDTLAIAASTPLTFEDGRVSQWNQFYGINTTPCLDEYLLLTSLQFKTDITGRDPSKWSVTAWQFNGIFYPSETALRAAVNSSSFVHPGLNTDGPWACTDHTGNVTLPHDELNPPVSVKPDGARFALDEEEKYVEWMDFSFYYSSTKDLGLQLHNIKYQGERIIYEVGLQEAVAHYASASDPFQASNAYLDSVYGFGQSSFQLVSGFDCPAHATYVNTSFYDSETTHTHPSSICMFEYDTNYPIQRHTAPVYVSITKNIQFVIRQVATVGNYDYVFDYEFYYDGSIHVSVRASGYIQSSFWTTGNPTNDGFHIHDHTLGSMHDHVLNYKLDLDVAGTANSLVKNQLVPTTQTYPWSNGYARNTMTFDRSFISSENDGKLNWDLNNNVMYTVVNKDAPNKYGEYRGYKMLPATGHRNYLTIRNSSTLGPSVNWADHHFYALQRHDNEQHSAYPYNTYDPFHPVIDFHKYFDGESLDQEDLVIYFNLGMHHVPDTSDLPNTVMTTAHSAMIIAPQNYVLEDPSRRTIHQTRINAVNGSVTDALTFGVMPPTCSVDLSVTAPNLQTFVGEAYISKYPYEPDAQEVGDVGAGTGAVSGAGSGGGLRRRRV